MTKNKHNILLTFSGIDGSGKSTLALRTVQYLEGKGEKASMLEVYASSIFLNMGKILGTISGKAKDRMEEKMYSGSRDRGSFIKALRIFCFFLDILVFRARLLVLKLRGISAVCDRYLYDTLIHLKYLKAVKGGMYSFLLGCIPQPDIPFILSLDARLAMGREMQHEDMNYYIEKIALYKTLADEKKGAIIDSSSDPDNVWEKVKGIIDTRLV